ncbi:MAG: ATP synthase subunit I [Moraxella sp.]|nr:ATP synthase subunit I [Moraxella sp.]
MQNSQAKYSQAVILASRYWRWSLLILIVLALGIDGILGLQGFFAKGLSVGALLSFAMQWIFTYMSYRHARPQAKQAMAAMYAGMLARWGVGIFGFVLIFVLIKSVYAWAVFLGFILMQISITASLYHFGKKI